MRKLFVFAAVVVALTSCQESISRRKTLEEYADVLKKINEFEKVLNTADFKSMSCEDITEAHQIAEDLYYEFNPLGLNEEQVASCEALKKRVADIRENIITQTEAQLGNFKMSPYEEEDVLFEKSQAYPVYLHKGEILRWNIRAQRPVDVKLCNADARSVVKTYSGRISVKDSLLIPNTAIYFIEINPRGTQYIDLDINYKVKEFNRLTNATPINTSQVECTKGDFGAVPVKGVRMINLFDEPRKFTLRSQLKSMVSGSSSGLVALPLPSGTTDVLYSMRIATSEYDMSSDGEFHDNMSRTYVKVKFLGLPLYERSSSNGLLNTLLDDNRPLKEEDAYCNMYVFRSQSEARKFQDGTASVSALKYDVDYSIVGSQSCNGRIPTYGQSKLYLGFENVRVRYTNYLWVEVIAVVPHTEYYTTVYSID